jgi:ferredoxin-NADP reductase
MKQTIVRVKSVDNVTHDVLKIVTEKPKMYLFTSGQATEFSINKKDWKEEKRPFTFTSLPDSEYLEFTIKTYPQHEGVTNELLNLKTDDELILNDVFGAITYKGEGVFIAGGAGVTPFISIFRDLKSKNLIGDNKLVFANKTKADIILESEFKDMLGTNFINILSDENVKGYANGTITEDFIKTHSDSSSKIFYLCGPPPMMEAIEKYLKNMEVDKKSIVKEEF